MPQEVALVPGMPGTSGQLVWNRTRLREQRLGPGFGLALTAPSDAVRRCKEELQALQKDVRADVVEAIGVNAFAVKKLVRTLHCQEQ